MDTNIITTIYESAKTKVYLVSLEGAEKQHPKFAVLKKHQGTGMYDYYKHIADLQSAYFPKLYEMWEESGVTCVLEEYISGQTLREILDKDMLLQQSEVLTYVTEICMALEELHSTCPPIIHRDIKPDNIMITKNGSLKLIDFDASREYRGDKDKDTVLLGTKEYASPEQFGFMQTDTRTDIYSLGIVLSELIKHAQVSKDFAKRAQKIVARATMFDPEQRYNSAKDMLKDVNKLKRSNSTIPKVILGAMVLLAGCTTVLFLQNNLLSSKESVGQNTVVETSISQEVQESVIETRMEEISPQTSVIETEMETVNPQTAIAETDASPEVLDIEYPDSVPLEEAFEYVSIAKEVHAKYPGIMKDWSELYSMDWFTTSDTELYSPNQDTYMGNKYIALRFFRAYPREIIIHDNRFEGMEIVNVKYEPYADDNSTHPGVVYLKETDYVMKADNIVALTQDFLMTLEPGGYTFRIRAEQESGGLEYGFYLLVHDREEKVDNFLVHTCNDIAYYSSDSKNDVAFFIQNTPYPIANVEVNGNILSGEQYQLVNDGFGIVVHPEFLEQYEEMQSLDFIFTMTSGQRACGRVIFLKHFEGEGTDE